MLNFSNTFDQDNTNPEILNDFKSLRGNLEGYSPLLRNESVNNLYDKISALNNDIHSEKSEELYAMAESIRKEYSDLSRIFGKENERYIEFSDEDLASGMGTLALTRAQAELPILVERQKFLNMELENCQKYIELSNLKNAAPFIKDSLDDIKEGESLITVNIFDYLDERNQALNSVTLIEDAINTVEKEGLNKGIMKPIVEEAKNIASEQLENIAMTDATTVQAEMLKSSLLKDTLGGLSEIAKAETQSILTSAVSFTASHLKTAQNALAMNYSDAKQVFRQINNVLSLTWSKMAMAYDIALEAFTAGKWSQDNKKFERIADAYDMGENLPISGRFAKIVAAINAPAKRLNPYPDKNYWDFISEQGDKLRKRTLKNVGKAVDAARETFDRGIDAVENKLGDFDDFLVKTGDSLGELGENVLDKTLEGADKVLDEAETAFNSMLDVSTKIIDETQKTAKDTINFVTKHNAITASICRKIETNIDKKIDSLKSAEQKIFENKQAIKKVMDSLDEKQITTPEFHEYVPSEELKKSIAIIQNTSPEFQSTMAYKAVVSNLKAVEAKERVINNFENLKEIFKADFKNSPFSDPKKTVETFIEKSKANVSMGKENISAGLNKGNIATLDVVKGVFEKLAKMNEEKAKFKEESKSKINEELLHDAEEHEITMD